MDEQLRAVVRLVITPLAAVIDEMVAMPDLALAEAMRVIGAARRRHPMIAIMIMTMILGKRRNRTGYEHRGNRGS